jgi:hypothetical protein
MIMQKLWNTLRRWRTWLVNVVFATRAVHQAREAVEKATIAVNDLKSEVDGLKTEMIRGSGRTRSDRAGD